MRTFIKASVRANTRIPMASSSATTAKSVDVSGPLALYSLMVAIVAAGAVESESAPKMIENRKISFIVNDGKINFIKINVPNITKINAPAPCPKVMKSMLVLCFFRLFHLRFPPKSNATMASAKSTITEDELRNSFEMIPVTEGLRIIPTRTYPLTFGSPILLANSPPRYPKKNIRPSIKRTEKSKSDTPYLKLISI
jgi:hypothetical protein